MVRCSTQGCPRTDGDGGPPLIRCAACLSVSHCSPECRDADAPHLPFCVASQSARTALSTEPPRLVGDSAALSLQQLLPRARAGDAGAAYDVGVCYGCGVDTPIDLGTAFHWLSLAVASPHPPVEAYFTLASCHHYGHGTPVNLQEAVRLYRLGAAAGDVEARVALAQCTLAGVGVRGDPSLAYALFLAIAVECGHPVALASVGTALFTGNGVQQDAARGVEYWLQAAYKGEPEAMYNLAVAYSGGEGVPQDTAAGGRWLQAAAAAGDVHAISLCEELGMGGH